MKISAWYKYENKSDFADFADTNSSKLAKNGKIKNINTKNFNVVNPIRIDLFGALWYLGEGAQCAHRY